MRGALETLAMLYWSTQQATICAAVGYRFGVFLFFWMVFFCLLANHIGLTWWRHGH